MHIKKGWAMDQVPNQSLQSLKWVRAEDGIIGGVCLALARQLKVEVLWVRIIWLLSFLIFGTGALIYLLCVLALPRTDQLDHAMDKKILGVCTRLAQRSDMEVGLIRLLALLFLVSSFGAALIAYVVLHLLLQPQDGTEKPKSLI
jgi:phage shock protein C